MSKRDDYAHGHAPSVVGHHARRTAADSAAFLLPYLTPGMDLLDAGCGPGSITADLAEVVHPGRVRAIDVSETAVAAAQALIEERALDHVEVAVGNIYDLGDDTYDVAYAHQVIQHLSEPVTALRELRRVLRPDAIVAVRDSDYAGMLWAPRPPALDRWVALYHEINDALGLEADTGRWLPSLVAEAGFTDITVTTSTWTHATPEKRAVWGGAWAKRCLESSYAEHAIGFGLATVAELEQISKAFLWWAERPHAMWMVPHVEVVARR